MSKPLQPPIDLRVFSSCGCARRNGVNCGQSYSGGMGVKSTSRYEVNNTAEYRAIRCNRWLEKQTAAKEKSQLRFFSRLLYPSRIWRLEVEAELDGFGARGYEVRAAECGEEVVQSVFVGKVHDGEAEAPLVAIAVEEVVVADGQVEQVPRSDARRILVVVFGAVGGDVDAGCATRSAGWAAQDRAGRRGERRAAEESDRGLLIGVERQRGGVVGHGAGNEAAVIAPVEADPRTALERLILQVRGLVEFLVVVDAEDAATLADGYAKSADLRREIAGCDARHHDEGAEAVPVGHTGAQQESGNFGVVPVDGKRDRRVAEHAEVVGVVRVLPDVLAVDDEMLAERLLQAGVKFVAETGW